MTNILTLDDGAVDRYANIFSDVAHALASGDLTLAEGQLERVIEDVWQGSLTLHAPPGPVAEQRTSRTVSERMRAEVLTRDGFRCTYCGGRTVPRCVLVAISDVFPRFAYDPHYGRGRIHPAYWALAPEVDHVVAHARGGASEISNLTTLHTFCNLQKSSSHASDLPTVVSADVSGDWDGLVPTYPDLVQAGNNRGHRHSAADYHPRWLRNFGLLPLAPVTAPPASGQG